MAWLSNNSILSTAGVTNVMLNNLANDIRNWGGDVNAGGYSLSNLAGITLAIGAVSPLYTAYASGGVERMRVGFVYPATLPTDNAYQGQVLVENNGSLLVSTRTNNASHIKFYTCLTNLAVERMRITSAGDVGIGTQTPGVALDIFRASGDAQIRLNTASVDLRVWANTGGSGVIGTNTAHPLILAAGSLAEKMRIGTDGRIGIGTQAAIAQVHVYGAGQAISALTDAGNKGAMLYLQDSASGGGNGGAILFGAQQGYFAAIKSLIRDGSGTTNGDLAISLRNGTSDTALTERVRITYQGRVGIGKAAPNTMLAVAGLPTYADNTAASGGGLTAGDFYRTSTGVLMVTY